MEQLPPSLKMAPLPRRENENIHEYQLTEEEERQCFPILYNSPGL